ncbi:MAG TPA: glycosyltransferase family 9 protein, partial [Candidatus Methylacidiphilales bacterium]|nr:glycosyltransferase family 9 protein [Candidatus Methylacidiphilales bacterium]
GDTIVALPAFRVVRQTYPEAHIAVLTNPPVSEKAAPLEAIIEGMGLVDEALYYPMASRDYAKLAQLHGEIRRRRFDLYVSITFGRHIGSSLRDYAYFRTAGIRRLVGFPWAKRDRVPMKAGDGPLYESEALRLIRRARAVNPALADSIDPNDPQWTDLKLTPAELAQGDALLRDGGIAGEFLVASVGAKWLQKDWGIERWHELFSLLGPRYAAMGMVMLGSADEFERSQAMLDLWTGPKANLCGKTGPRVSAAVMRHARLFIGHDSGPMHLAAAAGVRCVAIFCAHNPPGRWFPLGRGHIVFYPYSYFRPEKWDDVPYQHEAIQTITAQEVAGAVAKILG